MDYHPRRLQLEMESQENEDDHMNSSSGCELSFEMSTAQISPIRHHRNNRVRNGNVHNNFVNGIAPIPKIVTSSPPYRRVRALRLFDSPHTPKTILENASAAPIPSTPTLRTCLFPQTVDKPRGVPSAYAKRHIPAANVNPFSPNVMLINKKRSRSTRSLVGSPDSSANISEPDLDTSDLDTAQPTKRVALEESNISRYHQEFLELEIIGKGQFGSVFKCINRLDGCVYAIKKSTKPVTGSLLEKRALNEVYAHAVLGRHEHVVRYYSAWAEDNHMIIQNEYCDGGSLAERIQKGPLTVAHLRKLIVHVAEGLMYIHSQGLVHLDIKPGNIFISHEKKANYPNYDSADDGFDEVDCLDESYEDEQIVYKIGDLGHVTSILKPQVEDGDCRFISREILNDDYTQLPKADIFALGLTILEAAGSGPLPKNGPDWQKLRDGHIPDNVELHEGLAELVKAMIHPKYEIRPTPLQILQHRAVCPVSNKSKTQLHRELNEEKLKNEILHKQLLDAAKCIKAIVPTEVKDLKEMTSFASSCIIGKKFSRSISNAKF